MIRQLIRVAVIQSPGSSALGFVHVALLHFKGRYIPAKWTFIDATAADYIFM